jgi:hypothetical protein
VANNTTTIRFNVNTATIRELKAELKRVQEEMQRMRSAGQSGTSAYNNLKNSAKSLTTEIRGLNRELKGQDSTLKLTGAQLLEIGENMSVVGYAIKSGFEQLSSIISDFVNEANKLQAATIGLKSVADFKGIDPNAATNSIKNLDLVRNGLLTVSEASLSLKNLLATGFDLEESIQLIQRFGDAASFGRQGSLEFGYAVVSATEGLKNGNSNLVDNAGVTKNLSVILKEAGKSEKDMQNIQSDSSVKRALYNGLLKETQAQLGDASRLTDTYAGSEAKLNARITESKQTLGIFFQNALKPILDILNGLDKSTLTWVIGIGAITTALLVLIPTVYALIAAFAALNITTGGVLIILGAVATLIAGGAILASLSEDAQIANQTIEETSGNISSLKQELEDLKNVSGSLKLGGDGAEPEGIERLNEKYPTLIKNIKDETINKQILNDEINETIKLRELELQANEELISAQITTEVDELTQAYLEQQEVLADTKDETEELNELVQKGEMLDPWFIVGTVEATPDKLREMNLELAKGNVELAKGKLLGVQLADSFARMITEGLKTGKIVQVWNEVQDRLDVVGLKAGDVQNAFARLGSDGVASILGISKAIEGSAKLTAMWAEIWRLAQLAMGGNVQAAGEAYALWQQLQKEAANIQTKAPRTSSTGTGKTRTKETEDPNLKKFREDLEDIKREISLAEEEAKQKGTKVSSFYLIAQKLRIRNLQEIVRLISDADDKEDARLEILKEENSITDKIKRSWDEINKKYFSGDLLDTFKKRGDEMEKLYKRISNALEKIKEQETALIENNFARKRAEINEKFRNETEGLDRNISGEGEVIDNAIKIRDKELKDVDIEQAEAVTNNILSIGQQLVSMLGIGADTFAAKLINGLSSGISLANSILQLLSNLGSGGLSGGIFGILGSIFSGIFKAEGGPVTGGSPYIVGERGWEVFVPNSSGTIIPHHVAKSAINNVVNVPQQQSPNIYLGGNIPWEDLVIKVMPKVEKHFKKVRFS